MALTIGSTPVAGTDRWVVPSPSWSRRQPPAAEDQPISRVSTGRRNVSSQRSIPTTAKGSTAESVRAARRAVVWRAGTLTVPKPDRLVVRLVRTGTLVTATAITSATLLHGISTWSILPGAEPTPASRLWFAPVHTATDNGSALDQGAADAVPVTFTPARAGGELPTTSAMPGLTPTHSAATFADAGPRSLGTASIELMTPQFVGGQVEPSKSPDGSPRGSDTEPDAAPAAKPGVAKPAKAKPSTPVAPQDSDKQPEAAPAAKPSVAKPAKAKRSTPVAPQDSHKRPKAVPAAKPGVAKPTKAKRSTPVSPPKHSKKLTAQPTPRHVTAPASSGKGSGAGQSMKRVASASAREGTSPRGPKQHPRAARSAPQSEAQANEQPPQ